MHFVKLKQELPTKRLLEVLRDSTNDWEYRTPNNPVESVIGVSDGRIAAPKTLCFIEKPIANEKLEFLKHAVVITNHQAADSLQGCTLLIASDPRSLYIDMISHINHKIGFECFTSELEVLPHISISAKVHSSAIVEDDVFIGDGVNIAAGCVIKRGTYIGNNVTIRENTVIGCDGIALYKALDGRVLRFPHLGGVIIEDEVEVGASCVMPRGVLTSSRIGAQSVIGNLCNLGHATRIGIKVWMSVGCLIGGNTTIGDNTTIGLGVSVRDNLIIGDNCSLGMGSVIVNNIPDNQSVFGNPARRIPTVNAGPKR